MRFIWSYILVALCWSVTSAGVIDNYGNRGGIHGNGKVGATEEKLLTPPSQDSLIIDSDGSPGNSNGNSESESDYEKLCLKSEGKDPNLCELPQFLVEVFKAMENNNKLNEYQIIPFTKEDIINLEGSELCDMMCSYGIEQPPCKCE